jgi:nitrite reductase/ring-hydroxylating ferredoxin subunit
MPDSRLRGVAVDGREIGILHSTDEVFALRNICPHMLAPVCRGTAYKLRTYPAEIREGRVQVMAGRPQAAVAS